MTAVNLFKLINGQEVIAKIKSQTDEYFDVQDVREIAPVPVMGPDGKQGFKLTLAPYIFATNANEKNMFIYKGSIAGRVSELPDNLEKEYLSSVSGIMLAKGM